MHSYSLTEICDRPSEVFQQAAIEPVLLQAESQLHDLPHSDRSSHPSSYVILSAQRYQELVGRLSELEDLILGRITKTVLKNSSLLGTTKFTKELQRLVDLVSDELDENYIEE